MGEKQTILKLRKEGELFQAIAQAMGIASATIQNILKKKDTIVYQPDIQQVSQGKQWKLMTERL